MLVPSPLFRRTWAFVLAGGEGQRLHPLTRSRPKPAVSFGGVYRLLDFTLSNCVNSGIRRIHVLSQYGSVSLARHVRRGWAHLLTDDLGEFIDVVTPQRMGTDRFYAGTADAIFQNIALLQEERPEGVILLSGDHVYRMDYTEMMAYHQANDAVLTIACIPLPREHCSTLGVMQTADDGRIIGFEEKPADPKPMPEHPEASLVSMGVYIWQTETLVRKVSEDARHRTSHDFGRDIIPAVIAASPVYAYPFRDAETGEAAYWRDVGTLDSYWQANMDLVEPVPPFDLYDAGWPFYTYRPQVPPTKTVVGTGLQPASVTDSLVADGCIISGGQVHRSVLAFRVRIEADAEVEECVLMQDVRVGSGAKLRRAIVDRNVTIPDGMQIGYDLERDRQLFTVTPDGIVVVPEGTRLGEEPAPGAIPPQ